MPIDALSPELVLTAYRAGIFPMADPREDNAIYWYAPDARAIIPLDGLHISTSLARTVKSGKFTVQLDRDFPAVMRACAQPRPTQPETWISAEILRVYTQLHQLGHAHSVECWQDGALVGGLYGVALGGAFFGESMFHVARDASKVALVHLVAHLKARGYTLLDTQFLTPHLQRMGAKVITKRDYERRLALALRRKVTWFEPVSQPDASPQPT